jgi:hypothetical protein
MISLLQPLLRLIFPKLPTWVATLLISLISEVIAAVRDVEAANANGSKKKLSGAEKFELVSEHAEDFLSQRTGDIPGWNDINPIRRRKMIGGIVELAVFLVDVGDGELTMSNTRPSNIQVALMRRRGYKRIGGLDIEPAGD